MDTTLTLNDIILLLLGIAGVVLIIFIIVFISNLTKAVKNANKVLDDVNVISSIAAERAQDIDGIVSDVTASAQAVAANLKNKEGLVKTVTSLVSLITALKGLLKKFRSDDEDSGTGENKSETTKKPAKQQRKAKKK
ncbi:MAG: hypothetical protein LBL36_02130 [Clostridiales Family XIII bacterium]|jgi:predicted PurR-regulated permease PerM|nr:hypothetical protein [Clostridiales Family XIII bacterium]